MKRFVVIAALACAAAYAGAQTTTVNLSPFTPDACEAAKAKLGDGTLKCAATFTSAPVVSTISLSGLPDGMTTVTNASISSSASPAAQIWCRLDSYAPIICPQPFVLGASGNAPLSAGVHRVDYYASATAPDAAKPTKSYSWVVTATTPPPSTPPASALPSTGAAPLAYAYSPSYAIEAPSDSEPTPSYPAKGYGNGGTTLANSAYATITRGGVVRFGKTTDGGAVVLRHEIRSGDPLRNSGNRSELSYDGVKIVHGVDNWFAFAIKLDADWVQSKSGGNGDRNSLWQVHQDSSVSSGSNPFGLQWRGTTAGAELVWTQTLNGTQVSSWAIEAAAPGQWMKWIVHYRSGPDASYSPLLEIWRATGSGAFTKIKPLISPNTPWGEPQKGTTDWTKIGIYKWTYTVYGSVPKRGMYSSGLYTGKGANLYDNAQAALAAFN